MHDNYNRKTMLRTLKDTVSRADRCDLVGEKVFAYVQKEWRNYNAQYCLFYNES